MSDLWKERLKLAGILVICPAVIAYILLLAFGVL